MLTFINILLNYLHSVQFCLLLLIIGCLFFYRDMFEFEPPNDPLWGYEVASIKLPFFQFGRYFNSI